MNHKHSRIEENDVLGAQEDYSRFAFDALKVEGSPSAELDEVLLEFAGAQHTMPRSDALGLIAAASPDSDSEELFSKLIRANFIGLEVDEDQFEFPAAEQTEKRASVLATKLESRLGREPRVTVHPAFRPYLGIRD